MKWLLFISLFIAGATSVSAERCVRVNRIAPDLSKPQRSVVSRKDPWLGTLIGKSEAQVIHCQGEPAEKETDAWIYYERLGPGAHSFRHSWIVKFKRGKVVKVEVIREAVGCMLIPPPKE